MASDAQKVIATAGLVSVAVGSANSIIKYKKPPSSRFLIGSGIAWMLLSGMANSEAMAEVAKGLALGIMTTILLGEGGGVLTYFVGKEGDTTKPKRRKNPGDPDDREPPDRPTRDAPRVQLVPNPSGQFRRDALSPQPFFPGR